jgi:hypothetical protein
MTINWERILFSVVAFTVITIITLIRVKMFGPWKYPDKKIQQFNKHPFLVFFSILTGHFFCVTIVLDTIAVFTHSCEIKADLKYIFPLWAACFHYINLKYASKFKESKGKEALTNQ